MEPSEYQRMGITAEEVAYLTLGSWQGIAKGFELDGYCHECDDVDAISIVMDYFLDVKNRCVTAEVRCKRCSSESIHSFAVLDNALLESVLIMSRK